jgi:hypothetical protein
MGLAALVYRSLAICIRLPTVSFCFFTSRNKPQAVRCYSPRTWSHDNDAFVRRPGLGLLEKPTARRGLDSARSCSLVALPVFLVAALSLLLKNSSTLAKFASFLFWP